MSLVAYMFPVQATYMFLKQVSYMSPWMFDAYMKLMAYTACLRAPVHPFFLEND